jgi:hypothetical protein
MGNPSLLRNQSSLTYNYCHARTCIPYANPSNNKETESQGVYVTEYQVTLRKKGSA